MARVRPKVYSVAFVLLTLWPGAAGWSSTQQSSAESAATPPESVVPRLVNFSGVITDSKGKPVTGPVDLTFSLYSLKEGGSPLWAETQRVQLNDQGHYNVLLGSTLPEGLPLELFTTGQAQWLGVQPELPGAPEQPRVLLVGMPYALKAADSDTLGGLPASAFVQANQNTASEPAVSTAGAGTDVRAPVATSLEGAAQARSSRAQPPATITGTGTKNYVPLWTGSSTLGNSVLYQSNSRIGLGTTAPASTLDVEAAAAAASAPIVWLKNNASIQSGTTGNSVDIRFTPDKGGAVGTPNAYIRAQEDGSSQFGTSIQFGTVGDGGSGASERMRITSSGDVGIGTTTPGSTQLQVTASAGANWAGGFTGPNTGGTGSFPPVALIAETGDAFGAIIEGGNPASGVGGIGISAVEGCGPSGCGYAGEFDGDLDVTGAIYAGTKDFKVDHPLDPANKYLYHASVESSEMKNIYDGTVTTDANGDAVVELPAWFEALNRDFRYQLTVVGQFAQAIVASKIAGNRFSIKTDKPNVEVCWQVTGVRQDAYARTHPLQVEVDKPAGERGYYIHPELYGAPEERQIQWAQHPETMKRLKEQRETQAKLAATKKP